MLNNPNTRKWVYVAQVVLGAALVVLVATGIVDQATSDQITSSLDRIVAGIGGLALLGGGELARRNLSPKPATISRRRRAGDHQRARRYATRAQPAIETRRRSCRRLRPICGSSTSTRSSGGSPWSRSRGVTVGDLGPTGLLALTVLLVLVGALIPRTMHKTIVGLLQQRIDKLEELLAKRDGQIDRLLRVRKPPPRRSPRSSP